MVALDFNNIHRFKLKDLIILLDINTDSLHVIDEITWDYLDALQENSSSWVKADKALLKKYPMEEIGAVRQELSELIEQGILFTPAKEINEFVPPKYPIIKAMCLHVSHDCNLRCSYCFADKGPYGGDRQLMSEEVGKQAFEFLFKASKNRKNLNVDFFGGEPLMNFSVVKNLVYYAKERAEKLGKVIEFTVTTNGVLLNDKVQEFLHKEDISTVLSLDGRKEIHDKIRVFPGNRGSYDYIIKNYVEFINERGFNNYIIRGTYSRNNMDFTEDVKHLHKLGFKVLSLEPVVGDPSCNYTFKEEDLNKLFSEYEALTDYYLECLEKGEGFNFFHFNIDLFKGPCLPKRLSACGAGHEYVAVSPVGELYPCHQFVGKDEYKIGNVFEGVLKPEIGDKFQKGHVLNKSECKKCWARFYCSGGCHASNLASTGSLLQPYKIGCELQKKRLECGLYIQIKKQLKKDKICDK